MLVELNLITRGELFLLRHACRNYFAHPLLFPARLAWLAAAFVVELVKTDKDTNLRRPLDMSLEPHRPALSSVSFLLWMELMFW